jgi:hypothetical protein
MPKKKSGGGSGRGKKSQPDSEAALQRELKREKAEGKGVVGDMAKNRNLSGSSTWSTLQPPRGGGPKPKVSGSKTGSGGAADTVKRDIARVRGEIADRLRHRGVRLDGKETPAELTDLLDAVEDFEQAVEAAGGDLMVDEPATPDADVPADQRRFMLPPRRDGETASRFIARISDAASKIGR